MVMELFWYGYGCGMVLDRDDFGIALGSCVIYSNPLCGSHFMVIKLNGVGIILHSSLLHLYPCYYGLHIIISHT
jgi:hypothetical protein